MGSQNTPSKFEALAKAIQIIDISKVSRDKNGGANSILSEEETNLSKCVDKCPNDTSEKINEVETGNLEPIESCTQSKQTNIFISETALKDVDFVLDNDKGIYSIIDKLKSHTWPTQNYAIGQLNSILKDLSPSDLPQNDLNALFVLGRNIYQAACGNSFSAIQYLDRIDSNLSNYSIIIHNCIVAGALFEIFFDSKGELRSIYKYRHSSSLLNLDREKYTDAFSFLETKLLQYKETNIVYPDYADQSSIIFNVFFHQQQFDSLFGNGDEEYNYIDEIKIGTKTIQLNRNSNSFFPDAIEPSLFANELSQIYCLPESKVQIHYTPDINNDLKFSINGSFTTIIE